MRSLVLCAVLLAAVTAQAALPSRTEYLGDNTGFRYHWRVAPRSSGGSEYGVAWNISDSLNYDAVEVSMSDSRYSDAFGRCAVRVSLINVCSGERCEYAVREFYLSFSEKENGLSLVLERKRHAAQALLHIGAAKAKMSFPVDVASDSRLGGYALTPVDTLRATFDCYTLPAPRYADFTDVEALRSYLGTSTDPKEAEWCYHDRDTDPLRVSVGGNYRLATVSDGSGGYIVVLLSGAEDNRMEWHPLRIKATLSSTGFVDEYDLDWFDVSGESMGPDCSAEFYESSLLTFRFPLYKSSMRFRRVDDRK